MRTLGIALILSASMAGSSAAQSSSADELPAVFVGSVQSIVPPDRSGAWTLQIISRLGQLKVATIN